MVLVYQYIAASVATALFNEGYVKFSTSLALSLAIPCVLEDYFVILNFIMVDASTKKTLQSIPLLQTKASPRDKELWIQRLKEEYQSLIKV